MSKLTSFQNSCVIKLTRIWNNLKIIVTLYQPETEKLSKSSFLIMVYLFIIRVSMARNDRSYSNHEACLIMRYQPNERLLPRAEYQKQNLDFTLLRWMKMNTASLQMEPRRWQIFSFETSFLTLKTQSMENHNKFWLF